MNETMPWYKSTVIVGVLVSLAAKLLVVTGVISDISPDDETQLTNVLVLMASGVADLVAMYARIVQTRAPIITLKRKN